MKKNPTKALPPMSSRLRSRFRVVLISWVMSVKAMRQPLVVVLRR